MDQCPGYSQANIDIEAGVRQVRNFLVSASSRFVMNYPQFFAKKQENTCGSPPPYENQEPPPYSSATTPTPMSPSPVQYLCLFGFCTSGRSYHLCPLLWIVGALALLSPLRQILPWIFSTKPDELIHDEEARRMRKTEMKWASACLILISLFSLIGSIIFMVRITAKDVG
ncbi:hypothetical protein EDD18DRAFT_1150281 [Armillaria luteobubalina]|uniref:Uncharacterized protein n=1 Tax=Armillaria luteobubalina TaxID=153913 RepID=A0AA39QCP8_9AGAR|nr:hypothetical protein EDD18DRAFT_1150281 [Armillaria luteobubalina]